MPFKEIENHFSEHNVVSVRLLPVVFIVILRRLWQCRRNRLSLCLLPWLLDSLSLLPLGLTQVQCTLGVVITATVSDSFGAAGTAEWQCRTGGAGNTVGAAEQ